MKRIVSTLLAGIIAAGMAMPAFAADTAAVATPAAASTQVSPFKDVDVTTPQGQAILKMYENGALAGYEDGTFRPNGNVTRAELVRIINQVFGFKVNEKLATTDFSDNSNKNAWFYSDVRCAQQMGYISGFGDNTFRPQDNFTRQQACVVLTLLTNAKEGENVPEISDTVAPWAEKYVKAAISSGLFTLEQGNTFRATQNITRGELCAALADYINTEKTTEATTEVTTKSEATTKEGSTETTTKHSSSGGGGGGNRTPSKTTTTTTTTEAATETTTSASSNKKPTTTTTTTEATTTEATTELTTSEVQVDEALLTSIKRTKRNIDRYVIPKATSDNVKNVAQQISDAMGSFMSDYSYDVQSAANLAMDDYHALTGSEKSEFKNLVLSYCAMSDLATLRDTFFPGLTV